MASPGPEVRATSLFALVDTGEIFSSTDQGGTWGVLATLPVSDASGLVAGDSPSRLFLVTEAGIVYRSIDAGLNWTAAGAVPASDVVDIAARADGAILALTATGTVWKSLDQGSSFSALGTITASNLVSLAVGANGKVYALTGTGEVAESATGASWITVGTIAVPDAVSIRSFGAGLYVLSSTGLTYRSLNSGVAWTAVGTVSQVSMAGLTPMADKLVAVSREGLVARSANGTSWDWVGHVNQLNVRALANDIPQVSAVPEPGAAPRLRVLPPWPNPLPRGGAATLTVDLPEADDVWFAVYDLSGRLTASEPARPVGPGPQALRWAPGLQAPGVYFIRISTARSGSSDVRVVLAR